MQAAAVGLTEVKGHAVAADETITSPFTQRPCLLCHYIFVDGEGRGDEDGFAAGTLGVPFYLEDETGRLLVRPDGAEIKLPEHVTKLAVRFLDVSGEHGSRKASPDVIDRFREHRSDGVLPELRSGRAALLNFLAARLTTVAAGDREDQTVPQNDQTTAFDGTPRFIEARLEEGDEAYVLGLARPLEEAMRPQGKAAAQNERSLFIGQAPGSRGPFWSGYTSIFEIASGSEGGLVERTRREVRRQIGQGVLLFAVGLGCVVLVLLYGCGG